VITNASTKNTQPAQCKSLTSATATWTNRQNEWYNSERRFIFTCKSERERKKWMAAIRLAVADHKERVLEEEAYFQ